MEWANSPIIYREAPPMEFEKLLALFDGAEVDLDETLLSAIRSLPAYLLQYGDDAGALMEILERLQEQKKLRLEGSGRECVAFLTDRSF